MGAGARAVLPLEGRYRVERYLLIQALIKTEWMLTR